DLRTGRRTQGQELSRVLGASTTYAHCRKYLQDWTAAEYNIVVNRIASGLSVLFVNGRLPANSPVIGEIQKAALSTSGDTLFISGDNLIAAWVSEMPASFEFSDAVSADHFASSATIDLGHVRLIDHVWDLLDTLSDTIAENFTIDTGGYNIFERPHTEIHATAVLENGESIFIDEGSVVRAGAVLNASGGPIFIGKNVTVFENCVITGPAVIGDGSQIRINANIKNVAIGPVCKIGGEVHDSIIHSYSSKVHDGFLGHSYLGRWCNLGAGTNNSNLRNDYGPVAAINTTTGLFEQTDRQFLGLIMGDHSKCAIGTTFNTGTTIGVSCNLYGAGFHPRYVPSFMWGTPPERYVDYRLDKALEVARIVMARRNKELSDVETSILMQVFQDTQALRKGGIRT
ncbi:MAG: hypothetical protein HKN43_15865, partial [Rhodothermales bacterium]|nr:hypothetical protein [Rhodothermales bacterium]